MTSIAIATSPRRPGRALTPLAGRTFGRLTALERDGADVNGRPWWRCACACGEHCRVRSTDLIAGRTRSCGCLRIEVSRRNAAALNTYRARRLTSRSRVAARYAQLCGCSLTDAAVVMDLDRSTVSEAWRRVYPGVPALKSRRRP